MWKMECMILKGGCKGRPLLSVERHICSQNNKRLPCEPNEAMGSGGKLPRDRKSQSTLEQIISSLWAAFPRCGQAEAKQRSLGDILIWNPKAPPSFLGFCELRNVVI